jgi:hypothetical protein
MRRIIYKNEHEAADYSHISQSLQFQIPKYTALHMYNQRSKDNRLWWNNNCSALFHIYPFLISNLAIVTEQTQQK